MLVKWFLTILRSLGLQILKSKLKVQNITIRGHLEKCLIPRIVSSSSLKRSRETSVLRRARFVKKFSQVLPQVKVIRSPSKTDLLIISTLIVTFVAQGIIPRAAGAEVEAGEEGLLRKLSPGPVQLTSKDRVLSKTHARQVQKTTEARRGIPSSSPSPSNEGVLSLKRRSPSPEVGFSSSGSGFRSRTHRSRRIFPCKALDYGQEASNAGEMGILKIPAYEWEGWHRLHPRPGCSRFSHQWSKTEMVVRSPYEQQGQPPGFCCHQFVKELNVFYPMWNSGSREGL